MSLLLKCPTSKKNIIYIRSLLYIIYYIYINRSDISTGVTFQQKWHLNRSKGSIHKKHFDFGRPQVAGGWVVSWKAMNPNFHESKLPWIQYAMNPNCHESKLPWIQTVMNPNCHESKPPWIQTAFGFIVVHRFDFFNNEIFLDFWRSHPLKLLISM